MKGLSMVLLGAAIAVVALGCGGGAEETEVAESERVTHQRGHADVEGTLEQQLEAVARSVGGVVQQTRRNGA